MWKMQKDIKSEFYKNVFICIIQLLENNSKKINKIQKNLTDNFIH